MQSTTERLPKGRSYPLKPSTLASAVTAAGLTLPVQLTRWDKFDPALQARFYPDGEWPGKAGEFFWVSCKAVPSGEAAAVGEALRTEALPRLVQWAKSIEALDARSPLRREKQAFSYPFSKLG